MKNQLLHTPEGVRDIYNRECAVKLELERRLHQVIRLHGYQDIQTPTFEFFDIFNKERGSVMPNEMFKFIDREGNTLVLRPDLTPSIARCATKYFMTEDMPLRFCYTGNTYINNHSYQGRLKETTQMGCELIGDETTDAAGEIIAIIIKCMLAAGLTQFQVELGEVGFFNGLLEEADLDEETEAELREYIDNKNYFGMEEMLIQKGVKEGARSTFLALSNLFGTVDCLKEARKITNNATSIEAIVRLEKIYRLLECYGLEQYISFELGMLGHYKYYTGILFRGYTYGTGEAVVTGGSYNSLLQQFGKKSAAIGFAINVDQLLLALTRQKIVITTDTTDCLVVFEQEEQQSGIVLSEYFRKQERLVEQTRRRTRYTISDYIAYAKREQIKEVYYIKNRKQILVIQTENGEERETNLEDLIRK